MTTRDSTATHQTTDVASYSRTTTDPAATELYKQVSSNPIIAIHRRHSGVVTETLAAYRRRSGQRAGGDGGNKGLLSEEDLLQIEQMYADGITAMQIVDVFTSRGIRFSEASFRKYVQQGLLPRSRRIGRKGKHRGSMGIYPPKAVRRINEIKRLMVEGHTIEEIQSKILRFSNVIENVEDIVSDLFAALGDEIESPRFDSQIRRSLMRELDEARRAADELIAQLDDLSQRIAQPQGEKYRDTGAAGNAEDLL